MGRPSDSRERILESAARLWHERSYDGIGVAEICADAGVQKGSFYHFFAGKEALVLAVLDLHWQRMRQELLEPALDKDLPPIQRLRRLVTMMSAQISSQHDSGDGILGCPLGNLASELATRDETVRQRIALIFDKLKSMLHRTLHDAKKAGELHADTNLSLAAGSILTYIQGLAVIGKTFDDPRLLARLAEQVFILAGRKLANKNLNAS